MNLVSEILLGLFGAAGGGTTYTQDLGDTLTESDNLSLVSAYSRSLTDILTESDSISTATAFARSLDDIVTGTDSITPASVL